MKIKSTLLSVLLLGAFGVANATPYVLTSDGTPLKSTFSETVCTGYSGGKCDLPKVEEACGQVAEESREVANETIRFAFDSAVLSNKAKATLDALIAEVKDADYETTIVTGYTDRIGTAAYNTTLGLARAQAVKDYLLAGGICPNSFKVSSGAASQPLIECLTPANLLECLAPNRRVEINILKAE